MKNYEEVAGAILFQRYVTLCTYYQQHALHRIHDHPCFTSAFSHS
jgi:hypothetical protein